MKEARVPVAHEGHSDEKPCGCATKDDLKNKYIFKVKCPRCGSTYLYNEVVTLSRFICYDCGNDILLNGIFFKVSHREKKK